MDRRCPSLRDALTGVYNRSCFDDQFRRDCDRARLNSRPLSLIMIDVDNFKEYNDAFGHLHGDACLRTVAGALAQTTRRAGDFVARYGGEEFVMVLPGAGANDAWVMAGQARKAIMQLNLAAPGPTGRVTVSAGCATSERDALTSPSELVSAADAALYAAKRAGRNRVDSVSRQGFSERLRRVPPVNGWRLPDAARPRPAYCPEPAPIATATDRVRRHGWGLRRA